MLGLYRGQYFDFSVRHFCEKLREEHHLQLSYTWVKQLLQGAGLVVRAPQRGVHRRRRERRAMAGMMLHIDASTHRWLGGEEYHDLIVILDDAAITRSWRSRNRPRRCSRRCARWWSSAGFSARCIAIAPAISG